MAIETMDDLVNAMANNSSRLVIHKASIANTAAGQFHSLWRATGQPGQGEIPTSAAVCDNTLVGCLQFTQQTAPATSYLGLIETSVQNSGMTLEFHDRLMHMGGLSGTSTTSQTVNLDVHANISTANLANRIGASDYSDIQWWIEWYADTGGTNASFNVNVTYNDGSSGNLTSVSPGTTRRASFMLLLNNLIPSADSGKYIRDINSVTLGASTGAVGNFGFTATRFRAASNIGFANFRYTEPWANLGLPELPNSSCIMNIVIATNTSTGSVMSTGKVLHG